jgi:hypothetical protein
VVEARQVQLLHVIVWRQAHPTASRDSAKQYSMMPEHTASIQGVLDKDLQFWDIQNPRHYAGFFWSDGRVGPTEEPL